MSEHLTPETRAEWREDAEQPDWVEGVRYARRILALLDSLDKAERERDEWKQRRDNAVETCRFRHQDGLTAHEWHIRICGAMQGAVKRERERDEAREALARVREVHGRYFDTDRMPGSWDDHLGTTDPEPEDVWRFDRDFRAALAGTDPTDTEGDDRD